MPIKKFSESQTHSLLQNALRSQIFRQKIHLINLHAPFVPAYETFRKLTKDHMLQRGFFLFTASPLCGCEATSLYSLFIVILFVLV
ncbi:TPA: hypothetical protein DEP34_01385 [Candidatus Uhrbacteria bacterium]|nr:hypothetical protein [Candidatus Uhrbacteria bacterium]HCB19021.1 hypothetical protein [Candidatus Uhrbacteria bacterium]